MVMRILISVIIPKMPFNSTPEKDPKGMITVTAPRMSMGINITQKNTTVYKLEQN